MKSNGYKGPERRTYMRIEADYDITYIRLSEDLHPTGNIVEDAHSIDISGAGVKFLASEKIPAGSFMEVHIRLPGSGRFITAIGKVIRCEPERKKLFGIALGFAWMTRKDKEMIVEYVKKGKLNILRSETKI